MFCANGCLTGMSADQQSFLIDRIRRKAGAPVMQVELRDEQIIECICEAIEEYSSYVNNWVLRNRLGEMLGLPSEIDFTLKYVSNSLYFERSFSQAFANQQGIGVNGTVEVKLDSIMLSGGVQEYTVPAGREINEVLWYTPNFINLYGLDPFSQQNFEFTEFGASFAGEALYGMMPVFDTILTAQAASMRNRVRGAEYSYIIKPGPLGTKILKLLPVPTVSSSQGNTSNVVGTPGTVFYNYTDRVGYYGNSSFSGFNANPGFTGFTGSNSATTQGNGLVSTFADAQLNYISFAQLNSVAQTWVKKFAQALALELLGKGIRGKFNGKLPIAGAELELNKDDLINTAREDKKILKDELTAQLELLSYKNIMEERAAIQEAVNKNLGYGPMGIEIF